MGLFYPQKYTKNNKNGLYLYENINDHENMIVFFVHFSQKWSDFGVKSLLQYRYKHYRIINYSKTVGYRHRGIKILKIYN